MRNNLGWLLYWRWREFELNPDAKIQIQLHVDNNFEWILEIDTTGSTLENTLLSELNFFNPSGQFIHCEANKNKISGKSSLSRTIEMIQVFRECAEHYTDLNHVVNLLNIFDEPFFKFIHWHHQCHWKNKELAGCIKIETLDILNWNIVVDLRNTPLEQRAFKTIERHKNDFDWVYCEVQNSTFYAQSSPLNLVEVFKIFCEHIDNGSDPAISAIDR